MCNHESSHIHPPYKTKYRVENWAEYEKGLRDRADVTIWFTEEAAVAWTPACNGKRGGQRAYSDVAIETALTLRLVFHLPLRQTEGFVGSLLKLMKLHLTSPLAKTDPPALAKIDPFVHAFLPLLLHQLQPKKTSTRRRPSAPARALSTATFSWSDEPSNRPRYPSRVRSDGPSIRSVRQRCRRRSSSALTISLLPRKPYQSS